MRLDYKILFFLYCLLNLCLLNTANGQKSKRKYATKSVTTADSSSTKTKHGEFQLIFTNINKIPFYEDAAQLKEIEKIEEKGEEYYDLVLPKLEHYVSQFGITNFTVSSDIMWKLGQLYENRGYIDKAMYMYRLVLKHHKGHETPQILQHYTNWDRNVEKGFYVPLKDYYELVEYRKLVDTLHPPKSVFLNMGDLVNDSKFPDYGPTISITDNFMIFTKRKKEMTPTKLSFRENEDLYFSKNYDGFWDEAAPFNSVINSKCNEGSACLSRDGKTLYFARCKVIDFQYDCRDCMGSCDIYVSHFNDADSAWSQPKNLGPNVNTISWDSQPCLSHTEDTLYFASDRLGGFGLSDIYFTYKNSKGEWAPAQNIGPVINTRESEVSPFYHPMYDVLYFSSKGQILNFGDFDIYKSQLINKMWQEPKNIGPLVNGKGSEYYFSIDSKSKDLFYAKSDERDINNLDLYSFPLPMEAQPTATTILKGTLTDSATGNPFKGVVSIIDLSNGIEVAPKFIRPDGSYEFDLIDDNDYLLIIQGDDFFRIEEKLHLNGDTSINIKTPALKYNKWEFKSIEFEGGSSEITSEMEPDLDKVVNFLIDHPTFKLKISGHTDSDGNPESNLKLSQRRADSIKKYIVEKSAGSISEDYIEAIGYGDSKPIIAEEKTLDDKKINRRVEFEIIKPNKEPAIDKDNPTMHGEK